MFVYSYHLFNTVGESDPHLSGGLGYFLTVMKGILCQTLS